MSLFHRGRTLESREGRYRDDKLGILRCAQDPTSRAVRDLRPPGNVSVSNRMGAGLKPPHNEVPGIFVNLLCGFVNPLCCFVNPNRSLVDSMCSVIDPLGVLVDALL